jgi:hypothetical protein
VWTRRRIYANLLTVTAEKDDHITPSCQSEPIMSKFRSADKELFRILGGHIRIMAGSGASKHTWTHINGWLASPPSKFNTHSYTDG